MRTINDRKGTHSVPYLTLVITCDEHRALPSLQLKPDI